MDNNGIHNFLDCSTGHLTKEDCDKLDQLLSSEFGSFRTTKHFYGYYLWMPSDDTLEDAIADCENQFQFSPAFANVLCYAQSKNCYLINFDRDADRINDLKYFEW